MGTKFNKAQFDIHGKWAHYTDDNGERHFIARFRTAGVGASATTFASTTLSRITSDR